MHIGTVQRFVGVHGLASLAPAILGWTKSTYVPTGFWIDWLLTDFWLQQTTTLGNGRNTGMLREGLFGSRNLARRIMDSLAKDWTIKE